MAKKNCRARANNDTDVVARNLWLSLVRDFRASEGLEFCRKAEAAFLTDIETFRGFEHPEMGKVSVGRFKRRKQMQELLKKYRFAQDAFSDKELEVKTLAKYFSEQERLTQFAPQNEFKLRVAQRARAIAREILGSFEPEKVVIRSKFGKKSSIGCPLSLAYIDNKLSNAKAFTGSSQCTRWFWDQVLPGDEILSSMVKLLGVKPSDKLLKHNSLNLIQVPKSWKTYRSITPLTLLSLFYSNGLGQIVTERLRTVGLDIRRLQNRHRNLVRGFSMSRSHATADLSAASDSITIELLNQVLPRKWYCAVRKALVSQVSYELEGQTRRAYTASVLPMGNGLTFPVETLIFYCLIRAIGDLTGIDGVFSVYGDDLIYPSKLHKFVVRVFPHFKLKLNLDKTFVKYPFRESCGADFYRGADVRPFYLQGERQVLTNSQYQAYLYKTYNGLVRRWDPTEIRTTLLYLLTELVRVSKELVRVPPDYPDTAGIKVQHPREIPLDTRMLPWTPIYLSLDDKYGNTRWAFKYLAEKPGSRFVKKVLPYYWLALQSKDDELTDQNYGPTAHAFSYRHIPPEPPLSWRKVQYKRERWHKGKKYLLTEDEYVPTVSSRTGVRLNIRVGLIYEWAR
jgi:hypothetical protein